MQRKMEIKNSILIAAFFTFYLKEKTQKRGILEHWNGET